MKQLVWKLISHFNNETTNKQINKKAKKKWLSCLRNKSKEKYIFTCSVISWPFEHAFCIWKNQFKKKERKRRPFLRNFCEPGFGFRLSFNEWRRLEIDAGGLGAGFCQCSDATVGRWRRHRQPLVAVLAERCGGSGRRRRRRRRARISARRAVASYIPGPARRLARRPRSRRRPRPERPALAPVAVVGAHLLPMDGHRRSVPFVLVFFLFFFPKNISHLLQKVNIIRVYHRWYFETSYSRGSQRSGPWPPEPVV